MGPRKRIESDLCQAISHNRCTGELPLSSAAIGRFLAVNLEIDFAVSLTGITLRWIFSS